MLKSLTVADIWRPCEKTQALLYDILLIFGGSLFIALFAHMKFLLPFSRVPVTGQTFAVLIIGALLGAKRGSLTVLTYITEGLVGLPVFAMGSGLVVLRGFTGGYIIGFIFAAYIVGSLAERGWDRRVWTTILAMVIGNVIIYAFGLVWLTQVPTVKSVFFEGLYPFIAGDLIKIALAAVLLPSGWKLLGHYKHSDETE